MPKKTAKKQKKILLADDHQPTRAMFSMILSDQNYQMIHACNGEEAYAKAFFEKPDLILMDVMMPVMDGYDATREIRKRSGDKWIPIIFMSAKAAIEDQVAGLDAGGDDYLTKPVNSSDQFVAFFAEKTLQQTEVHLSIIHR